MHYLKRILQLIYCFYALIVFAIFTILAAIALIFLLPFGKQKLATRIHKVCRYWGKCWYLFTGLQHQEIFEAAHNFNRPHIFVANHNSYMDIPPIVMLRHQPIRPLGKFESSKIPIFGWIYKAAVIMVDRSSPEKRAKSLRNLKAALHKHISIFIFPEGTFSMTLQQPLKSFYNGAFKLAIEMQVPIQPILMIDAVDRMHFDSVSSLNPGKNRVVYLPTIEVSNYKIEDMDILKEKVYQMMDEGLRKYRNYPNNN
jgi:1-acyl-sn-glycerol-3-phosphate acyltransferase